MELIAYLYFILCGIVLTFFVIGRFIFEPWYNSEKKQKERIEKRIKELKKII